MKLFHSATSPFVRKVMVVAHETGRAAGIDLVSVASPTLPTQEHPELSRHNPLAKIPALVLDDGTTLFDSRVICEYLDKDGQLVPKGPERFRVLTMQALADGVIDAGILMRFEHILRPEPERSEDFLRSQERKILAALDALEKTTFRDALDLGQIALVCALEWLELRKPIADVRSGRPKLFAWLDRVKTRPSFVATAPR
jgi:glutathione S-transferase